MSNSEKGLQNKRKSLQRKITDPLVRFLVRLRITPNQLTWLGFWLIFGAAALIITEHYIWAGVMVIISSVFDMLDGGVARATQNVSSRGAFLDSTLDRMSEGILFIALLISYNIQGHYALAAVSAVALFFCFMVSYLRARAEALNLTKTVGFFTRPERIVVLVVGLLVGLVPVALGIIVVGSFITMLQRATYIWKNL